ncbi:hypothetical protein PR048_032007 [Dryococelus australis]|uniref:HTH CENPB-type domain-containing protein n=1 Tax=Dryococelus australis TaxID=614101 RepID=A0ABQ9G9T2_9NEOP|nr:hypothetical protein PR048_032007 [Dryococelus australis]
MKMNYHTPPVEQWGTSVRQINSGCRRSNNTNFKVLVVNEAVRTNSCAAARCEVLIQHGRLPKTKKRHFSEVDERVALFVRAKCDEGKLITWEIMLMKAIEVAAELDVPKAEFKVSIGWCRRMRRRFGLTLQRTTTVCQKLPADGRELHPYIILKRKTKLREKPLNVILRVQEKGRPGALLGQRGMLVVDSFCGHVTPEVKASLQMEKTDLVIIPSGMTFQLQVLDVAVNKPFKDKMKALYNDWLLCDNHPLTPSGKIKKPSVTQLCAWISAAWMSVKREVALLRKEAALKMTICGRMSVKREVALLRKEAALKMTICGRMSVKREVALLRKEAALKMTICGRMSVKREVALLRKEAALKMTICGRMSVKREVALLRKEAALKMTICGRMSVKREVALLRKEAALKMTICGRKSVKKGSGTSEEGSCSEDDYLWMSVKREVALLRKEAALKMTICGRMSVKREVALLRKEAALKMTICGRMSVKREVALLRKEAALKMTICGRMSVKREVALLRKEAALKMTICGRMSVKREVALLRKEAALKMTICGRMSVKREVALLRKEAALKMTICGRMSVKREVALLRKEAALKMTICGRMSVKREVALLRKEAALKMTICGRMSVKREVALLRKEAALKMTICGRMSVKREVALLRKEAALKMTICGRMSVKREVALLRKEAALKMTICGRMSVKREVALLRKEAALKMTICGRMSVKREVALLRKEAALKMTICGRMSVKREVALLRKEAALKMTMQLHQNKTRITKKYHIFQAKDVLIPPRVVFAVSYLSRGLEKGLLPPPPKVSPPAGAGWEEVRTRKEANVQRSIARLHSRWDLSVPHIIGAGQLAVGRYKIILAGHGETAAATAVVTGLVQFITTARLWENMQTDAIHVNADNPVGRLVVRPDIYQHAERAQLLSVPGSEVEDRQYQLDIGGLSLHTGAWRELARVLGQPMSSASALHTMSENPALEWNNLAPCDEGILPHVTLLPVISRLNLCAVLAPAIFYRDVLVCGASLEMSITTAVHASISLSQVLLGTTLLTEVLRVLDSDQGRSSPAQPHRTDEPEDSGVDCADVSSVTDEKRSPLGVATTSTTNVSEHVASKSKLSYSSLQAAAHRRSLATRKQQPEKVTPVVKAPPLIVPVEVLFTAGTVSFTLYEVLDQCTFDNDIVLSAQQNEKSMKGSALAGESMVPLLRVVIAEPHVFVSHLSLCHKMQASCFDLSVHCCVGEQAYCSSIPKQEHFSTPILETKAGDSHPDTGIPPSFLTAIWSKSIGKAAFLELELGRPTKLDISVELLTHLQQMTSKLLDTFSTSYAQREQIVKGSNSAHQVENLTGEDSVFTMLRSFLSHTSKMHVNSQQVMVVLGMSDGWAASLSIICLSCSMSGPMHPPVDRIVANSTLSCLTVSTSHCGESRLLLNPWTVNTAVNICWDNHLIVPQVHCLSSFTFPITVVFMRVRRAETASKYPFELKPLPNELEYLIPRERTAELRRLPRPVYLSGREMSLGCANLWFYGSPHQPRTSMSTKTNKPKPTATPTSEAAPSVSRVKPQPPQPQVKLAQVQVSMDSDCILLDVGPDHLRCIQHLWQEYSLSLLSAIDPGKPPETVSTWMAPGAEPRQDQHYHDDLRAGAFRYSDAESTGRDELPLPYQVAFWADPPTMAWRYPQPRALTKVDVFPVPFQLATAKHASRDQVLCSLEYWCECRSSYQLYATFQLSEQEMCRLELPQAPRIVASCAWRVQLFIRSPSSNDDEDDEDVPHLHVSPRALAACMLVDSFYSLDLIPQLQLSVSVSSLQLSLYNHLREEDVPPMLEGYTMDSLVPESQCFLTLSLDKCRAFVGNWLRGRGCCLIQLGGSISCNVVDYAYLCRHCIVEPFAAQVEVVATDVAHVSCVTKLVVLKLGPPVAHTLAVSAESWLQALGSSRHQVILTKYVICNDTMRPIRFGQAGTDEDILLMSKHCHMYVWRTQKAKPLLRVGIEEGLWVWCESFPVNSDEMHWCPVSDCGRKELNILVKVVSLSATQKVVIISGQLVIMNKLVQHLECQVIPLLDDNTKSLNDVQNFIVAGNSTVPSILVDSSSKLVLRIRFHGQDSMWSGDIPLSKNTNHFKPWLVKVPLQDKGQFLSVWCRVIIQKMGARRSRVLAILCPLYMICSHLAAPAKVMIDTPGLQVHLESEVKGRGEIQQLYCPGTIDHTHSLTFRLHSEVPASDPVPLSYTMIDQREFFAQQFSEDVNLDDVLESLTTVKQLHWPYLGKEYDGIKWKLVDQPETDVRVKYEPLNEFCSTLLVSLQPWALFANTLGAQVCLIVGGSAVCQIPHSGVVSPPKLPGTFHVEMAWCGVQYSSQALQLARLEQNTSFYMPRITGLIPVQGNTQVCLQSSKSVVFANIVSDVAKEMHIISIQPRYIILNCSLSALEVVALAVNSGKKHMYTGGESISLPASSMEGIPLVHFTKLDDGEECLTPYVAFSGGAGFSCPLRLSSTRARQNFTVPCKSGAVTNCTYVLTMQERNGQVFVAVLAEPHPPLLVHNKCQFDLLCAQVSVDKDHQIVEETPEFDYCCVVGALSSAYYSMPLLSERFPSLGRWGAVSHVAFAIRSEDIPEWSLSFCILESREQFVHVPRHGDVKVKVETLCHTAHVTIESVSHVEISARDIRSRLSNKDVPISSQTLMTVPPCGIGVDDRKVDNEAACDTYQTQQMTVYEVPTLSPLNQLIIARFEVFLQGLCVKMFDDVPKQKLERTEVILLSCDSVCLEMEACGQSGVRRGIGVSLIIGDMQLDNQMFYNGGYDFAVIFTGQSKSCMGTSFSLYTPAFGLIEQIRSQALINVGVFFEQVWNDDGEILSGVKNLDINIGPLCAYIEDTFVVNIIDYLLHFLPHKLIYIPKHLLEPHSISSVSVIPEEVWWSLSQLASPLRINCFTIRPIFLMMSIHSSAKLYIAIDHSPLHFASFDQCCVVTTPYRLGHALTMHYMYGAIFGAGWVVGSLELIGSPGGLARTVGTGLRDFVYLPYQGIFQGPWGFLVGVTHGSASLMKHVTAGTLSSVTKLAASIARNIDRLSLDQEHLERTEELRRRRPRGIGEGLIQGLTGLGISLLGAIGGIAHHPLQSVLSDGASPRGLAAGVGRGLVGAVTKPLSGAAELLALTGQGLLHGAGWSTQLQVRRQPAVEHISAGANSILKYGWKLVAGLAAGRHTLLHVADATLRTPSGGYKPVALVLTTQALFVVDSEEDVTQRVLSLSELCVAERCPDPTLLSFQFKMPAMPMDMDPASHARVVDYVRHSTSLMHGGNDDIHSEAGTSQSEGSSCEQGHLDTPLTFLISPLWRNYFVCVLELAKRHSQGRGFAVL